jgi:hypothetical protein
MGNTAAKNHLSKTATVCTSSYYFNTHELFVQSTRNLGYWIRFNSTRDSRKISSPILPSAGNSMDEILMWVQRGISWLFFNIVPTNIDAFAPPLHELEEPLLVKVSVLCTDECPCGCFSVFIGAEMVPFECPLQSRKEVQVTGHQVGTVGMLSRRSYISIFK